VLARFPAGSPRPTRAVAEPLLAADRAPSASGGNRPKPGPGRTTAQLPPWPRARSPALPARELPFPTTEGPTGCHRPARPGPSKPDDGDKQRARTQRLAATAPAVVSTDRQHCSFQARRSEASSSLGARLAKTRCLVRVSERNEAVKAYAYQTATSQELS